SQLDGADVVGGESACLCGIASQRCNPPGMTKRERRLEIDEVREYLSNCPWIVDVPLREGFGSEQGRERSGEARGCQDRFARALKRAHHARIKLATGAATQRIERNGFATGKRQKHRDPLGDGKHPRELRLRIGAYAARFTFPVESLIRLVEGAYHGL